MGDVKISVDEAEGLTLVQGLRLQPRSLERHRVVRCTRCACASAEDATFNRGLKFLFLIILIVAVISLIIYEDLLTRGCSPNEASSWGNVFKQMWLLGYFQMGIALLAMFAAVLAGSTLVNAVTRSAGSPAPWRDSVQTISARVRQVTLNTT